MDEGTLPKFQNGGGGGGVQHVIIKKISTKCFKTVK